MKKFMLLVVLFVTVFALSACKEVDDNTLSVWVHVPEDSPEGIVYSERIQEFNELHEDYNVELEFIVKSGEGTGYNDRINAAIIAEDLPDVMSLESVYTASYVDADLLLPLDEYLDQSTLDSYLDTIIKAGTVDGNLYSLQSFDLSAPVFYNVDIFEAAGITIPQDENGDWTIDLAWTYDEFLANAVILRDHMGEEPVHMYPDNTGWQMYAHSPLIFGNGGQLVGDDGFTVDGYLNSASTIEAFEFFESLFTENLVSPTVKDNAFALENAAIAFEGPWMINYFTGDYPDLNWSLMPYPTNVTGNNSAPHGSWYLGATANTNHPEIVSELVAHMTNEDSASYLEAEANLIPGHKALLENSDVYGEYPMKLMLDQFVASEHVKPVTPIFPVIEDVLGDIIEGLALGNSLDDLVPAAIQKVQQEADRFE